MSYFDYGGHSTGTNECMTHPTQLLQYNLHYVYVLLGFMIYFSYPSPQSVKRRTH